jgi:hypothetical protein
MTRLMNIILKSLTGVLEATGNYRVLRRLEQQNRFGRGTPAVGTQAGCLQKSI